MVQLNPTQPSADPVTNEPASSHIVSIANVGDSHIPPQQPSSLKKIVIMGPAGSGKTSWVQKVRTGHFANAPYVPNFVRVDSIKVTSSASGTATCFNVWDTSGDVSSSASGATTSMDASDTANENFIDRPECYFTGAQGFVFFFDLTIDNYNQMTCWSKVIQFMGFLKNHAAKTGESLPRVIFVANKLDTVTQESAYNVGLSLNGFVRFVERQGKEFGITDFYVIARSVKNDNLQALMEPLVKLL